MLYEDSGKHQEEDGAARTWATRTTDHTPFSAYNATETWNAKNMVEEDVGHPRSTHTPASYLTPTAHENNGVPWSARANIGINTPLPATQPPQYKQYSQYTSHSRYRRSSLRQKIALIAVVICVIAGTIGSIIIFRQAQTHAITSQHITQGNTTTLPTGPASSGDNAQLMHMTFPPTVTPKQAFTVQFTYANNGTTMWASGNGYILACTIADCMTGNILSLSAQKIAPGQQYTFIAHLIANGKKGAYLLTWQMLHQGSGFGDTATIKIAVQDQPTPAATTSGNNSTDSNSPTNNKPASNNTPTNNKPTSNNTPTNNNNPTGGITPPASGSSSTDNSLFVSGSLPVITTPGQSFTIQLTFQNNGTSTWAGNNYALTCNTTVANVNCMQGGTVGLSGNSIAPGQSFTFILTLAAPQTPATVYTTAWIMNDNSQAFGDSGAVGMVTILDVTPPPSITPVTPPSTPVDDATSVGQSANPTAQEGQQFSISFTLQNTGTTTWSDNSYTLACLSTCLGASSAGFNGQTVAPGQQFQFNITQTAPTTPGTYTTSWILQDNGTSFGPTLSIDMTVAAPTSTWQPVLQQGAPDCNNPTGTSWNTPLTGTSLSCGNGGLVMQQTSAISYAELDLAQAGGGSYSQNNFRVQVQATFLNTNDTSTWAGLLVQTPATTGVAGGFIFVLNPAGWWQLQQVVSGTNIPIVASGSISITPGQATLMTVIVQNGTLYASVNGTQVLVWGDNNNPSPGLVGLMVERLHTALSSAILYTNFELDQ